ncbi:MAG: hypothetical protein M3O62_04350, partial [Pseudomonadota bacterium]|nr:hypothetical protein [Pseudomonadota bacterium]
MSTPQLAQPPAVGEAQLPRAAQLATQAGDDAIPPGTRWRLWRRELLRVVLFGLAGAALGWLLDYPVSGACLALVLS